MGKVKVTRCPIEGLYILEPKVFGDSRGYFCETYNERELQEAGITMRFVQDNESMSSRGVLRGLHYQMTHPQGKLVRVLQGRVYDVAVDIRPGSPTYGQHFGVELSAENRLQFCIAPGFAHGYLALSERAVFAYKVTDYYHPEDEAGIAWDDPEIGIVWPEIDAAAGMMTDGTPLSIIERDRCWPRLKDLRINGEATR